mgnify:CR=1 FL=1|tara:strand:+ start:1560 stop:1892 length:333 start_codon:yes stop_codon:yes gene_type:complete
MYLNIYQCSQAYGGPEEGGWWYSCGELIDSKRISNLTRARQTVKELNKKFKNDDKGEYQMGFGGFDGCDDSGEGDDDYLMLGGHWGFSDVRACIEEHPGKNYPSERPHYE